MKIATQSIPAYSGIGRIHPLWLKEALRSAPQYGVQVAGAMSRVIRCIHGLEHLHRTTSRPYLEVYLGRATETSLEQRWEEHARTKQHHYGAVLFCCDPGRVKRLEEIAVRLVKKLRKSTFLCVGNVNTYDGDFGGDPRTETAMIYMTWTILDTPISWGKPNTENLRTLSRELHHDTDREFAKDQILRGLRVLRRVSDYDPLYWWNS